MPSIVCSRYSRCLCLTGEQKERGFSSHLSQREKNLDSKRENLQHSEFLERQRSLGDGAANRGQHELDRNRAPGEFPNCLGSYTVSVTYGGDTNYAASAAATTVAVVVGLVTPTIDWTQPAPITYGTTLSGVLNRWVCRTRKKPSP